MLSMPQIDLSERRYGGCTFSPDFDGTLQQAREGEQGISDASQIHTPCKLITRGSATWSRTPNCSIRHCVQQDVTGSSQTRA